MTSAFTSILQRVVDGVPGAIGAVFADWDGEPVDQFSHGAIDEIQITGAQWGVVWHQVNRALERMTVGRLRELWIESQHATLLIYAVTDAYFVLLAAKPGTNMGGARREIERALEQLRSEM